MKIVNLKRRAEEHTTEVLERAEKRRKVLSAQFREDDVLWEANVRRQMARLKRKREDDEIEAGRELFKMFGGLEVEGTKSKTQSLHADDNEDELSAKANKRRKGTSLEEIYESASMQRLREGQQPQNSTSMVTSVPGNLVAPNTMPLEPYVSSQISNTSSERSDQSGIPTHSCSNSKSTVTGSVESTLGLRLLPRLEPNFTTILAADQTENPLTSEQARRGTEQIHPTTSIAKSVLCKSTALQQLADPASSQRHLQSQPWPTMPIASAPDNGKLKTTSANNSRFHPIDITSLNTSQPQPQPQNPTFPIHHLRCTTAGGKSSRWSASLNKLKAMSLEILHSNDSSPILHVGSNSGGLEWNIPTFYVSELQYSEDNALLHIQYYECTLREKEWWVAFGDTEGLRKFLACLRTERLLGGKIVEVYVHSCFIPSFLPSFPSPFPLFPLLFKSKCTCTIVAVVVAGVLYN